MVDFSFLSLAYYTFSFVSAFFGARVLYLLFFSGAPNAGDGTDRIAEEGVDSAKEKQRFLVYALFFGVAGFTFGWVGNQ